MTERLRKILRGSKLTPMTADEFAVKEAIDNAGSGGDKYETVTEIEIQPMEQGAGIGFPDDWWYRDTPALVFDIDENETYYWNDSDHPCDSVLVIPNVVKLILFNCVSENDTIVAIDATKPSYAVIDDGREHLAVESSEDISNTTVKILKKVSGGGAGIIIDDKIEEDSLNPVEGGAIYDRFEQVDRTINDTKPLIISGTLSNVEETLYVTITTPLADIYTAAEAGRAVFLEWTDSEDGSTTRLNLTMRNHVSEAYTVGFSTCTVSGGNGMVVACGFDNSLVGEIKIASAT